MNSTAVLELVRRAEAGYESLDGVPRNVLFSVLSSLADSGCCYAQLVLGRALVGASRGLIKPTSLVAKPNYREGYARLLRAAHGKQPSAWFELYLASGDYRSVLANQSAARFFAEQAALAGVTPARTLLALFNLRDADSLDSSIAAQRLLYLASRDGDLTANLLLQSFVVPDASTAEDRMRLENFLDGLSDQEMANSLRVAHQFRLTKAETSRLAQFRVDRYSLLVTPRGRSQRFPLPALTSQAAESLLELRQMPRRSIGAAFARRRRTLLEDSLAEANINESVVFALEGANLSRYRSLSAWKTANKQLIKISIETLSSRGKA